MEKRTFEIVEPLIKRVVEEKNELCAMVGSKNTFQYHARCITTHDGSKSWYIGIQNPDCIDKNIIHAVDNIADIFKLDYWMDAKSYDNNTPTLTIC